MQCKSFNFKYKIRYIKYMIQTLKDFQKNNKTQINLNI